MVGLGVVWGEVLGKYLEGILKVLLLIIIRGSLRKPYINNLYKVF